VVRSSSSRGAPACSRPFGLDCGSHCLDAFIQPPAGAFVVALTARRSWFCSHQRFAVLLEFGRRRAGLAEKGRAGPDVFVAARMRVLRHAASRLGGGLVRGRAG
jgi:hypothetical protein